MTAFRLRIHRDSGPRSPLPGDVLRNEDTDNRWRVLAAREVRTRTVDPDYPRVVSLQVERMQPSDECGECIVWPFVSRRG